MKKGTLLISHQILVFIVSLKKQEFKCFQSSCSTWGLWIGIIHILNLTSNYSVLMKDSFAAER